MSCSVECVIVMYSVPKLIAAVKALALLTSAAGVAEFDELKIGIEERREIQLKDGVKEKVDFVLKNMLGDEIGVRAVPGEDGKPSQVQFVAQDLNKKSIVKSLDVIKQAYARLELIDQLNRKGYNKVKEERLPNGSIRLVVQKWR